jgi:hypothetical protein
VTLAGDGWFAAQPKASLLVVQRGYNNEVMCGAQGVIYRVKHFVNHIACCVRYEYRLLHRESTTCPKMKSVMCNNNWGADVGRWHYATDRKVETQ